MLTGCAVRGIETEGGAVAGVVTERGPIACYSVVLAGGAWSSLFCGNLGMRLPQLKVMNSVLRTEPLEGGPEPAICGRGASRSASARTAATPSPTGHATRRHRARQLPACARTSCRRCGRSGARCASGVGGRFFDEARHPAAAGRWTRRRRSRRSACSIRRRQSRPRPSAVPRLRRRTSRSSSRRAIAQHWAGYIDVTPDAVPVISPVERIPGLLHRHRLLGPRLRHRAGGRPADGRPGDRSAPIVDPTPSASRASPTARDRVISGF